MPGNLQVILVKHTKKYLFFEGTVKFMWIVNQKLPQPYNMNIKLLEMLVLFLVLVVKTLCTGLVCVETSITLVNKY